MLRHLLNAARITPEQCANLLGVSSAMLNEWAAGQREIPRAHALLLASILGVKPEMLTKASSEHAPTDDAEIAPAIWYKLRTDDLLDVDREAVFLIRQLGFYLDQLEVATGTRQLQWSILLPEIRKRVDRTAPPAEQGYAAAAAFLELTGLRKNRIGIGDLFRTHIRQAGILVVESPIRKSKLEGCSFTVGSSFDPRPCIFANVYGTTWFRRNEILLHEFAHAIFESDVVSVDVAPDADHVGDTERGLEEARANAFAEAALLPIETLRHLSQRRGIRWDTIAADDLAYLMAATHAEQRLILEVARRTGLITASQQADYSRLEVWERLRGLSDHALNTLAWSAHLSSKSNVLHAEQRNTTTTGRTLRLPIRYVMDVVAALRESQISLGKAAEMLMITEDDLQERFPADVQSALTA